MKSEPDSQNDFGDGNISLSLEPDIVALGEYLAGKYGLSLSDFIELLITTHASKGKLASEFLIPSELRELH